MDAGFAVERPDDYVKRKDVGRAREVLGRGSAPDPSTERLEAPPFEWPHIRASQVQHLEPDYVEGIHAALTEEFRGTEDAVWPEGVKDRGLLESAVLRAQNAARKFPDVPAAGAALVHGLIQNHPFHNGNKRTALISLVVFLENRNGYFVEFDEDQIYELVVNAARHTIINADREQSHPDPHFHDREVLAIYHWIEQHTSSPSYSDSKLRWGQLETLLRRHGCEIDHGAGNKRKVRRDGYAITTGARNDGDEMDVREIRRIRAELQLDVAHGYDSEVFYSGRDPHPDLGDVMRRYGGVLRRLALLDRT
jgi:death-on-curing family protein